MIGLGLEPYYLPSVPSVGGGRLGVLRALRRVTVGTGA